MLNKWLFIFVLLSGMASVQISHAQLLEDRNKLKTARRETGFPWFKKKAKTKSHDRNLNPKFSVLTTGKANAKKTQKYPQRKEAGKAVVVRPRFSTPLEYGNVKPTGNREKGFLPTINLYGKPPRHKPGPGPGHAGNIKGKAQKTFHAGAHNQNIRSYKKFMDRTPLSSPNAQTVNYGFKIKKTWRGKNMYPSTNYLSAKYNKSRAVRNVKRKFNIVWVRMYGNKTQPDAVKEKTKKVAFDRHESEIWNN